jgi:hypothetical protein
MLFGLLSLLKKTLTFCSVDHFRNHVQLCSSQKSIFRYVLSPRSLVYFVFSMKVYALKSFCQVDCQIILMSLSCHYRVAFVIAFCRCYTCK